MAPVGEMKDKLPPTRFADRARLAAGLRSAGRDVKPGGGIGRRGSIDNLSRSAGFAVGVNNEPPRGGADEVERVTGDQGQRFATG